MHPIEQSIIRAFVIPAKRDRLLKLLASPKRRRSAIDSLNHFRDWDPRYAHSLTGAAPIVEALVAAGAGDDCHVISDNPKLDGQTLPLMDAIDAAEMHSFASILCCVPGKLALFIDEAAMPRRRMLLQRLTD